MSELIHENTVVVMNEWTWNELQNIITDLASKKQNPLDYLLKIGGREIVIDNDLADNVTEIWEKDVYEDFISRKGERDVE